MKKVLFFLLALLISFQSLNAQIIFSNDTVVCGIYLDTLQALSSNPTGVTGDDDYSSVVPIGFPFTFYGQIYTDLLISDNCYVTFDISNPLGFSPYSINNAIPNAGSEPENAIMAPWQDLDPNGLPLITYSLIGIAPNRRFQITWCNIQLYGFSCFADLSTSQIVLHEGSNKIEIFIKDKVLCAASTNNGGDAVHGLVDATSVNFDIVDDPISGQPRNFGFPQWTATNEGWDFIPNTPATSYTINQIPYVPIISGTNTWTDTAGNVLAIGPLLPVNILSPTTYYASVVGSCSFGNLTDSINIIVTACFTLDLTSTEASCLGNDGSITCTPDTLLPSWNISLLDMNSTVLGGGITSDTSFTFTNLFPGTYIVNVTSGISSSQDTIVVAQIPNPVTINSNPVGVSCYNGSNGQVAIWPSGGLAPYTFLINGSPALNAFPLDSVVENLSGGTYIVSAIDDNNCMMRDTIIISVPGYPLQALVSSKVTVSCYGGSDGIAIGSAGGGSPASGYIYSWYESGNSVSFSSDSIAVGLSAGSYYLSVEDANGCDTFTTINVTEPQFALQGSVQMFAVACKGDDTGVLVGDAGGGWGPYVYYWLDDQGDTIPRLDGQGNIIPPDLYASIFDSDTLSGLVSGAYQLHIYDSKECFVTYTLDVTEPDVALSIDIDLVESISCNGDSVGKAILYASGGMPNSNPTYTYLWENGETTTVAEALTSGYQSVVLSDDWGCEVKDSIYIPENDLIESDLTTVQDVSCYNLSDGIASISTSQGGSSSTYTYFWSQGQQTQNVTSDVAVGLLYGSYYVTTRDDLGCEVVDSLYISEPDPLSMEASELDWVDCFGDDDGEAFATATGGTLPYIFVWDNDTLIQGDTINPLTEGVHVVIVTDYKGCTASDTVLIHEPTALTIEIVDALTILPYCVGVNTASLSATASGGTLGYTYEWDDNLVLPQTTTTATDLLAGTYTITVTDYKGCTASDTRDIDITTDTTALLSIQVVSLYQYADSNDVSCFGYNDGGAEVSVIGGHTPYTYEWVGGSSATTSSIDNLYAGTYSVLVRDVNNCMVNGFVFLAEPSALTFNTSTNTAESCLGACDGVIFIDSLAGGVTPYTALLTHNITATISSHIVSDDFVILGVCSGEYTIVLTDVNDCPSSVILGGVDQQLITFGTQTQAQIDTVTAVDIICHASSTGVLTVLDPNMNADYTYSWQDLNGTPLSTGITADNLSVGVYVLHADYANTSGCTTTDTLEIFEFPEITNTVIKVDVNCFGTSTGSIAAIAAGGLSPYSYSWGTSPIQTGSAATNLGEGIYSLTVTDFNNCENEFSYTINQVSELVIDIAVNNTYVLTASVLSGGIVPYTYQWNNAAGIISGATSSSYTVSSNGSYYVVVTDANDCKLTSDPILYGEITAVVESALLSLSIYPNPFRDETTVDFGRVVKQASIRVVDVFGKLIEEHKVIDIDKYIIKREDKASGIYFMEINVEENEKTTYKLIIE